MVILTETADVNKKAAALLTLQLHMQLSPITVLWSCRHSKPMLTGVGGRGGGSPQTAAKVQQGYKIGCP